MKHGHSSNKPCPGVGHRHNTDTYNYTELYDFLKLLTVSVSGVRIRAS